ncbi:MAG TPA: hypothetical protein VLD37_04595 [Candidatus Bilamarchaeum sp.]|nr:hypothetical protein [Candidatus Bilamarchaeum sp.]
MSDDCCKDGSCGSDEGCSGKSGGECGGQCGCCMEDVDVKALGPEAEELAKRFDEVNANLVNALRARKEILEMLHTAAANSPGLKEKYDKVLSSRHPVLIQFVFGQ